MSRMRILNALLLMMAFAGIARGQGFIIPRPGPVLNPPVLTNHEVDVKIEHHVARVRTAQVFKNYNSVQLEGIYYFPVPDDISITSFTMKADGKVLEAKLLKRDEARKLYEDIVRRNLDPALLEYAGANMYRVRIFPIPPKGEREIEINYSQLLHGDGGAYKFAFPLGTGVSQGAPRMPDRTSTMRPPRRDAAVKVTIDLKAPAPIASVYSPTHNLIIDRPGTREARINYEGKARGEEDRLLLFYTLTESEFGLQVLTYEALDEDYGYFLCLLAPRVDRRQQAGEGKDIVFVVDVSGSMKGEKIEQARSALRYCIERLSDDDRFNVIAFSTDLNPYRNELVSARGNRGPAAEFVQGLAAEGSTDINRALTAAMKMIESSERSRNIVFVTDGLPTVGVKETGAIVRNVSGLNQAKAHLFAFGVGYDVDTHLLDLLAEKNRGASDYVEPKEDLEGRISGFYDKIRYPVLTDLELEFDDVTVRDVYPKDLPDLFKGGQLTMLGRYKGRERSNVKLVGSMRGGRRNFDYRVDFAPSSDYAFIPKLWATRKIGYLMDEIRLHGENDELKKEIEELSEKYGVLSPYASMFIEEDMPVVMGRQLQPQPLFDAMSASGRGPAAAPPSLRREKKRGMAAGASSSAGAAAVQTSKALRAYMMSDVMAEEKSADTGYRTVGNRIFEWRDDRWVDAKYKEDEDELLKIKHGSDAYLELLFQLPEAGKFLKLGKGVIFRFKGRFIEVGDEGVSEASPGKVRGWFK